MVFRIWSHSYKEDDEMPNAQRYHGMGQNGGNLSPSLFWEDAPDNTKSFVITMYDPDAPTGSGWWHWVVVNISPNITHLVEGASSNKLLPEGAIEIRNDFGQKEYGGGAPPPGKPHRYIITIHALNIARIDVTPSSTPAFVGFNVHHHSLASAQLICHLKG